MSYAGRNCGWFRQPGCVAVELGAEGSEFGMPCGVGVEGTLHVCVKDS